jgi:hypothetical protein
MLAWWEVRARQPIAERYFLDTVRCVKPEPAAQPPTPPSSRRRHARWSNPPLCSSSSPPRSPAPMHRLSSPSRSLLSLMASRRWPPALVRRALPLVPAPSPPVRRFGSRCVCVWFIGIHTLNLAPSPGCQYGFRCGLLWPAFSFNLPFALWIF